MTPRHLALAAALLGAAALVLFGDRTPETGVAEAVERPSAPASGSAAVPVRTPAARAAVAPAAARGAVGQAGARASGQGQAILSLVPRDVLIGDSEGRFGQGDNGGGVFGRQDWTPPPPMAPPLPFTFIGKSVGEGAWEIYLARGDRTYVVRDKDVIDGTYRVDAIAPPVLTLTYLPLNQVQQMNIGGFE